MNLDTFLSHVGTSQTDGVIAPIELSSTFHRNDDLSYTDDLVYARADNPLRRQLEIALATLENGTESMAFASGQAATMAVFQALPPQSHVLLPDDAYYGTAKLFDTVFLDKIHFSLVDMSNLTAVENAIQEHTKLIWVETPSNPQLKITNLTEIGKLCKQHQLLFAVDNTWATPLLQQPFLFGADFSVHSLTKYLNGHSDVIGGAVICKEKSEYSEKIRLIQQVGGGILSPFSIWLTMRGMRTLSVRMEKHVQNAQQLANFLENHPKVEKVYYPGLQSHIGHAIAKTQMSNFGGMLSFCVKGGETEALTVQAKTKLFIRATSLGGTESLIEHRKSVEGEKSLTPNNLLRVSVGLENIQDLIADLENALGV